MIETERKKADMRVENARAVDAMMLSNGWKLVAKQLEDMRNEAMYHVLAVDVESVRWRERLRTLDEVLGVPELFLLKGKMKLKEERAEHGDVFEGQA